MSFEITSKGKFYLVEDMARRQVIGRYETKEKAEEEVQKLKERQKDYFKDMKSHMTLNSEEQIEQYGR